MPHDFNNSSTGDVILRSGGPKVAEFRVHKVILSIASPVFEEMFSLPQPATEKDLPVCDIFEDAATVEALLRLVYPVEDPDLGSLDQILPILDAAEKYQIAGATHRLRKILVRPELLEKAPLQAYAIATRWGFEEEMKIISGYTLGHDMINSPSADVLNGIPAIDYRRLLIFHLESARSAQQILEDVSPRNPVCSVCRAYVDKWHEEFKRKAKEELSLQPTSKVICSFDFLGPILDGIDPGECSMSSCRKGGRKVETYRFYLEALRRRIDMLPKTMA